tara:strand:- start:209 stop:442 length:234 start_codon:yes stop_codon:yes gene_type:complete
MSGSIFITAIGISIIYVIFKFIEMRIIVKENKPLKVLFRDTLIVYLSVLLGNFVLTQISPNIVLDTTPEIFTNEPSF